MALASQIAKICAGCTCLAHIGHPQIAFGGAVNEEAVAHGMVLGEGDDLLDLLDLIRLDVHWSKCLVGFFDVPQIDLR